MSAEIFGATNKPLVVIIGAGLAGLSAAFKLIESGHNNLLVVEAKRRSGGRIKSHYLSDGSRIDLGAQWLHGERENPVYSWLKDLDLIEGPEDEEVELEGTFRTQYGTGPPADLVSKMLDLLMDAKQLLYKMSGTLEENCKPVNLFRNLIKAEVEKCPQLKAADPQIIFAILRWFELYETIDNSCEDLSEISLRAYSEWTDFDEGRMVKIKGGWQSVVDKLTNAIGDDRFIFECPVEKVCYSNNGAIVKHASGSIECDHVIVTTSIGVLKNLKPSFFEPPIGEKRREALKSLGFGVINKIFLQFEQPYLSEEKGIKLVWLDDKQQQKRTNFLPLWTRYMTGFDLVSDAPNCLLAWVGGEGAKLMERHSEEEIGQICLEVFRAFVPERPPPKLISVRRSTWGSDRYIRGGYSYESRAWLDLSNKDKSSITSASDLSKSLWAPLCIPDTVTGCLVPRVLFAGEATAASMYATAAGAIVSGWREAELLGKLLNKSRKVA